MVTFTVLVSELGKSFLPRKFWLYGLVLVFYIIILTVLQPPDKEPPPEDDIVDDLPPATAMDSKYVQLDT